MPARGSQLDCMGRETLPLMSAKGDCRDNATVECVFGSLKCERTDHALYPTHVSAKADVIEMFNSIPAVSKLFARAVKSDWGIRTG